MVIVVSPVFATRTNGHGAIYIYRRCGESTNRRLAQEICLDQLKEASHESNSKSKRRKTKKKYSEYTHLDRHQFRRKQLKDDVEQCLKGLHISSFVSVAIIWCLPVSCADAPVRSVYVHSLSNTTHRAHPHSTSSPFSYFIIL